MQAVLCQGGIGSSTDLKRAGNSTRNKISLGGFSKQLNCCFALNPLIFNSLIK